MYLAVIMYLHPWRSHRPYRKSISLEMIQLYQECLDWNYRPGPSCSKLTISLVNVSLKFWPLNRAFMLIVLLKKYEKLLQLLTLFFSKNTCEIDIVLTRTVTILTTNELVKLTMFWTLKHWHCDVFTLMCYGNAPTQQMLERMSFLVHSLRTPYFACFAFMWVLICVRFVSHLFEELEHGMKWNRK